MGWTKLCCRSEYACRYAADFAWVVLCIFRRRCLWRLEHHLQCEKIVNRKSRTAAPTNLHGYWETDIWRLFLEPAADLFIIYMAHKCILAFATKNSESLEFLCTFLGHSPMLCNPHKNLHFSYNQLSPVLLMIMIAGAFPGLKRLMVCPISDTPLRSILGEKWVPTNRSFS